MRHYKVFDMFCSNGSTHYDKDFFNSKQVLKNDTRSGDYQIYHQKLVIRTDSHLDMFKLHDLAITADVVYLDPPHLKDGASGIMFKKYTSLPNDWEKAIDNMFANAVQIAPVVVLKWCDSEIELSKILDIAEKYFYITFGNRRKTTNGDETTFITLIRIRS